MPASLWAAQFLISVCGGTFGAGIGIPMLAAMAIFLPDTLQHANALKVLLAMLINGVAALHFLAVGAAHLPEAGLMAVASVVGGYAGARVARRLPATAMRVLVVADALLVAARLFRSG